MTCLSTEIVTFWLINGNIDARKHFVSILLVSHLLFGQPILDETPTNISTCCFIINEKLLNVAVRSSHRKQNFHVLSPLIKTG